MSGDSLDKNLGNSAPQPTPAKEAGPAERASLEMPLRTIEGGGDYSLDFASDEAAAEFVRAFWAQVDSIRAAPPGSQMHVTTYLNSGMFLPLREITVGCRTDTVRTTDDNGRTLRRVIVWSNGTRGGLQPYGVQALRNLGIEVKK